MNPIKHSTKDKVKLKTNHHMHSILFFIYYLGMLDKWWLMKITRKKSWKDDNVLHMFWIRNNNDVFDDFYNKNSNPEHVSAKKLVKSNWLNSKLDVSYFHELFEQKNSNPYSPKKSFFKSHKRRLKGYWAEFFKWTKRLEGDRNRPSSNVSKSLEFTIACHRNWKIEIRPKGHRAME